MSFRAVIESVGSQLSVVTAAPVPFAVVVSICGVGIWQVCRWYYDGRISALEGRLALKSDEVANLQQAVAKLGEQDKNRTADNPSKNADEKAERRVLDMMANALKIAEVEIAQAQGRFSNRSVPTLKAAILSASDVFGITVPYPAPNNHGGPLTLGSGLYLLRQVLPLLEAGHVEEAQRISKEIHDDEAERRARIESDKARELREQGLES